VGLLWARGVCLWRSCAVRSPQRYSVSQRLDGFADASTPNNVPPASHVFQSLSLTQSNGKLGRDEDLGVSPRPCLKATEPASDDHRPCPTKPIPLVRTRGERGVACEQTLTQTLDALFWDAIFSMDITSTEGLSKISTLIHSPSKITAARSLRGDDAQRVIDLTDQASNPSKHPPAPRMLIIKCSFFHYLPLIRKYLGGSHDCSTRSAKPVGCCPHHIPFNQSPPILVNLDGAAASRT
jgi:hypothetical protein